MQSAATRAPNEVWLAIIQLLTPDLPHTAPPQSILDKLREHWRYRFELGWRDLGSLIKVSKRLHELAYPAFSSYLLLDSPKAVRDFHQRMGSGSQCHRHCSYLSIDLGPTPRALDDAVYGLVPAVGQLPHLRSITFGGCDPTPPSLLSFFLFNKTSFRSIDGLVLSADNYVTAISLLVRQKALRRLACISHLPARLPLAPPLPSVRHLDLSVDGEGAYLPLLKWRLDHLETLAFGSQAIASFDEPHDVLLDLEANHLSGLAGVGELMTASMSHAISVHQLSDAGGARRPDVHTLALRLAPIDLTLFHAERAVLAGLPWPPPAWLSVRTLVLVLDSASLLPAYDSLVPPDFVAGFNTYLSTECFPELQAVQLFTQRPESVMLKFLQSKGVKIHLS